MPGKRSIASHEDRQEDHLKAAMPSEAKRAQSFMYAAAHPADIPALMRLKRLLAQSENSLHAVRANEAHWLRDGFGPDAGFRAFVAERATRIPAFRHWQFISWNGDVQQPRRYRLERAGGFPAGSVRRTGIPRTRHCHALMARIAAFAREIGSPIVELTVRSDNAAAQTFTAAPAACHCRNVLLTSWPARRSSCSPIGMRRRSHWPAEARPAAAA